MATVLRGIEGSGKSTTLRIVYDDFKSRGRALYRNTRAKKDIRGDILEVEGTKIGFLTAGDNNEIPTKHLNALKKEECVVIVCAARTNIGGKEGAIVDHVEFLLATPYKIKWFDKTPKYTPAEQARSNREMADDIIKAIEDFITNLGRGQ